MNKTRPRRLAPGAYLADGFESEDSQMWSARWEFIMAIRRNIPAFFELLRDEVYPAYARFSKLVSRPVSRYWERGWHFETWRKLSDPDYQLTPILVSWARRFNVEEEQWVLEGALQTLADWDKTPESREALEIWGFRRVIAEDTLISDHEHRFIFEDWGWDPQFQTEANWRQHVRNRFEQAVEAHITQIRTVIEDRGAKPAVSRYSLEHFDWLALYKCGGWTLESIPAPHSGGKTTKWHGIRTAARLANIKFPQRRSKLKKR